MDSRPKAARGVAALVAWGSHPMLSRPRLIAASALAAAALVLTGCSSSDDTADSSPSPSASETPSESASPTPSAPAPNTGTGKLTLDPAGPYAGGETVTVAYSGFKAGEAVDITICANDGRPLAGPQSCAPLGGPSNQLVNADPTGAGTAQIVIINGPLGNTEAPPLTCGAATPDTCAVTATDLSATNVATAVIKYQ